MYKIAIADTPNDFFAKFILWGVDFLEINDSTAWAIVSKPAEDLIFFEAFITSFGIYYGMIWVWFW